MFVYVSSLKAAALFSDCIVVEQQAVFFFWSEGGKTSGIYRRMFAQYGEHFMAQKNV